MKPMFTPVLAAAAAMSIAAPGFAAAGDVGRGRALAELCAPCHGPAGVSPFDAIPNLAGQQPDYLKSEMKTFRRATDSRAPTRHWNRRRERVMDHQLQTTSTADIDDLAAYFAAQACALPKTATKPAPPLLAQRCVSCHGENGQSRIATVPHLAGQHQRYLENQLKAFRDSGGKGDAEPRDRVDPIMGQQSVVIGDADMVALARFFAAQSCR